MTSDTEEPLSDPLDVGPIKTEIHDVKYLPIIKEEKNDDGHDYDDQQTKHAMNLDEQHMKIEKEESYEKDEGAMDISKFLDFGIQTKNEAILQVKEEEDDDDESLEEDMRDKNDCDPEKLFILPDVIPEDPLPPENMKDSAEEVLCGICNRTCKNKFQFDNHRCEFGPEVIINPTPRHKVLKLGHGRFSFRDRQFEIVTMSNYGSDVQCYKCSTCGRYFRNRSYILVHINTQHSEDTELTCGNCKITFENLDSVRDHDCASQVQQTLKPMRRITDVGNGKFVVCDRWSFHLDGHYFVCDECGVKKKIKQKMAVHITSTHSDSVKQRCDQCLKWFSHIKRHMVTHAKEGLRRTTEKKQKNKYFDF